MARFEEVWGPSQEPAPSYPSITGPGGDGVHKPKAGRTRRVLKRPREVPPTLACPCHALVKPCHLSPGSLTVRPREAAQEQRWWPAALSRVPLDGWGADSPPPDQCLGGCGTKKSKKEPDNQEEGP